ncbi:MAG: ParB/RepB/Spo0J family partition protein [Prevotellaceae bacterium]|jgi:ParB family chromosome partitioning protein|nr:ParB/RepB/Spo0J family partition protein [Prevotellaceae bacterium]
MKKQASRLGRGLDALINTDDVKTDGGSMINEIALEMIEPNPAQPRTVFDEEALQELAVSIEQNGIIAPVTLRQIDEAHYQIIAGERRFRASKLAGLTKIPAYIRTADDEQMQIMALIENIQRTDLNAIEIALGYHSIMENSAMTQEALSVRLGKNRATIANYLRLLNLPAEIQLGIKDKKIDMGHARALAGVESAKEQLKIYEAIVKEGLSVRKTEELVKNLKKIQPEKIEQKREKKNLSEEFLKIKTEVSKILNANTNITVGEDGKGKISIAFDNDDDLNRIMAIFDKIKEKEIENS